ncbi:hypothetical protein GCM10011579_018890 [Streptomyces albiflavescens]|uniref:Uncharacterized protein n=1 Tax=Streptomyces albiflavescens TaxID=1623582 RepID=A0A918D1Q4_9ACTN|nr:hypothetical protein GCM10011579_018890 [Streptomyces albiflavescens]
MCLSCLCPVYRVWEWVFGVGYVLVLAAVVAYVLMFVLAGGGRRVRARAHRRVSASGAPERSCYSFPDAVTASTPAAPAATNSGMPSP